MTGDLANLSRRAAVGTMAAAGLGFALFGRRARPEDSRGRKVLNYWEKWTRQEADAMQKVVRDFNNSQDRLYVRYLSTAAIDEKAQIAIAGNAPPDILGLWNYNIPPFSETGAIIPLDDIGAPFGVRPENYATGMRRGLVHRDRMWGVISTGGTLALYYNKSHFREVGLDPEQPPRTIGEFDAAVERLTKVEGGKIRRMGYHHREPGWWAWIWGFPFGGQLYDEKSGLALIDSPENIAGYEWVQSYPRKYGLRELNDLRSSFGNYDSARNAFVSGQLSMVMQGPWLANVINLYAPELDYGVAPFPVADGLYDPAAPIGLVDTDVLVIPRGAKHPEASMEFIAYTQRQEVVEFLSTVHCKASPLAVASEPFMANHPNKGVRVFDAIAKSPRSFRMPPNRAWLQVRDEFIALFDQAWNLTVPARDLLAVAQRKADAILAHAAEQNRRRRKA